MGPFRDTTFTVPMVVILLLLFTNSITTTFLGPLLLVPLGTLATIYVFVAITFGIRVRSEVLRVCVLLNILSITVCSTTLIPLPSNLAIFFFITTLVTTLLYTNRTLTTKVLVPGGATCSCRRTSHDTFFNNGGIVLFTPRRSSRVGLCNNIVRRCIGGNSRIGVLFSAGNSFRHLNGLEVGRTLSITTLCNIGTRGIVFFNCKSDLISGGKGRVCGYTNSRLIGSRTNCTRACNANGGPPFHGDTCAHSGVITSVRTTVTRFVPSILCYYSCSRRTSRHTVDLFFRRTLKGILTRGSFCTPRIFGNFTCSAT